MKGFSIHRLMVVMVLLVAACGGDAEVADTTAVDPPANGTDAAGESSSATEGVVIESIDFDSGMMTLRNTGSTDVELSGYWICNRPNYHELDAVTIPAGGNAQVDVSPIGVTADDGELGLYTSSDFASADAIVAYVQWGSTSHGRASVAVEAGVWTAGDTLPGGQAVIESSGDAPISSGDWSGS